MMNHDTYFTPFGNSFLSSRYWYNWFTHDQNCYILLSIYYHVWYNIFLWYICQSGTQWYILVLWCIQNHYLINTQVTVTKCSIWYISWRQMYYKKVPCLHMATKIELLVVLDLILLSIQSMSDIFQPSGQCWWNNWVILCHWLGHWKTLSSLWPELYCRA